MGVDTGAGMPAMAGRGTKGHKGGCEVSYLVKNGASVNLSAVG